MSRSHDGDKLRRVGRLSRSTRLLIYRYGNEPGPWERPRRRSTKLSSVFTWANNHPWLSRYPKGRVSSLWPEKSSVGRFVPYTGLYTEGREYRERKRKQSNLERCVVWKKRPLKTKRKNTSGQSSRPRFVLTFHPFQRGVEGRVEGKVVEGRG